MQMCMSKSILNLIEARVCTRKRSSVAVGSMHREPLQSAHTLQVGEPVQRHLQYECYTLEPMRERR